MAVFLHRRFAAFAVAFVSLIVLALSAAPAWAGNITESSGKFQRTPVSASTIALIGILAVTLAIAVAGVVLGLRAGSRRSAGGPSVTQPALVLPTATRPVEENDQHKAA